MDDNDKARQTKLHNLITLPFAHACGVTSHCIFEHDCLSMQATDNTKIVTIANYSNHWITSFCMLLLGIDKEKYGFQNV